MKRRKLRSAGSGQVLLLVGDAVVRMDMRETLERSGFAVETPSAPGGWERFAAAEARPRAAILQEAPGDRAIELAARRLREAGVPTLRLTTTPVTAGGPARHDILELPCRTEDVVDRVRSLIGEAGP